MIKQYYQTFLFFTKANISVAVADIQASAHINSSFFFKSKKSDGLVSENVDSIIANFPESNKINCFEPFMAIKVNTES